MKLTLQQKLDRRKFRSPNSLYYWIYHFLGHNFLLKKYNTTYKYIDDIRKEKGPCFIIWNHLSRIDHFFIMNMCYPKKYNMVAGYNEFFRGHLHLPFKLINVIPKKNFTTDVTSIKAMTKIIRSGGSIAFSPEGMSSIYGHNQPIVEGTGHFFKHFNIPVYFIKFSGQYLTQHKVCLDERYGKTVCEMSKLFSPEDLQKLSDEEVNEKINQAFRHDDYEWNKTERIKFSKMENSANHLSDICYKCPKCGKELTMKDEGNKLYCTNCGNGAIINECYDLIPLTPDYVLPESPSKWVDWERTEIINEIRNDPNYSVSVNVKVGELPKFRFIKHQGTSVPCGEGVITFNHDGIFFKGVKNGKNWEFNLSYKVIYSLVLVTDVTFFSLYVNGEYYDFFPDKPIVGKLLLLTEEMHRLKVNSWKNFPWDDYMYKGIDGKPL